MLNKLINKLGSGICKNGIQCQSAIKVASHIVKVLFIIEHNIILLLHSICFGGCKIYKPTSDEKKKERKIEWGYLFFFIECHPLHKLVKLKCTLSRLIY